MERVATGVSVKIERCSALLGLAVCLMFPLHAWGAQPAAPPTGGATVKSSGPNAGLGLTRAIESAGIINCKPLSDRALDLIVGETPSSGLLFVAPQDADTRIFSTSIAVEDPARTTYASASFASYGYLGCGMAVDFVTYWPDSCANVATVLDKQLQAVRGNRPSTQARLGTRTIMLDGGPNMRMFLMPAGAGCVQIKKEMLY